jgi:tight adherence protein C
MVLLISVVMFSLLMVAISYVGYRYYARPGRYYEQIGTSVITTGLPFDETVRPEGAMVRIIRQIGEKVPISPQDASLSRRYLIAAGYRSDSAVGFYYGTKAITSVALFVLALIFRGYIPVPVLSIVFVIGAAVAGYFLPGFVLERMVSNRQERLKLSLPDALDLLVVCVEAGLGLDQAIVNVSRELALTHKDISEEFGLVTLEMRAGKRRSEALRNLAERTGEAELRKLVAVLIQTDRFGTSMADSLRTHSDFMRIRRRQEAEERANKVGVKLVFPIFFCILPAMFVVVAGPGLLQIFKQLFPLMRKAATLGQ